MKKRLSIAKKIFIGLGVAAVFLATAVIIGIIYISHYLNSPEFLNRIREESRSRIGSELRIGAVSASIFKGFVIKDIILESPAKGDPSIFRVDEILLKYNLSDLLWKKIAVNKIMVISPRIQLRKNSEGEWILPAGKKTPPSGSEKGKEPVGSPRKKSSWEISIESLQITKGSAELIMGEDYDPILVEGINLNARLLSLTRPQKIEGHLDIEEIKIKKDTLVSPLGADFNLEGMKSLTASLEAVVANGRLSGAIQADLKNQAEIPYQADLDLKEIDIAILSNPFLPENEKTRVTGKAFGKITADGNAYDPDSLLARGDLDIKEGTISDNPIQNLLARLMNNDEHIKIITFDKADAEFLLKHRILDLNKMIIHSHKVILTAQGTVDYNRNQELEMRIGVNFQNDLVDDVKPKELREIFQPSKEFDDYRFFQFKVWGNPKNLDNDLAARLIQRGTSSWLKEELFKKDREKEENPELTEEEREKKAQKREKKEKRLEQGIDALFKLLEK